MTNAVVGMMIGGTYSSYFGGGGMKSINSLVGLPNRGNLRVFLGLTIEIRIQLSEMKNYYEGENKDDGECSSSNQSIIFSVNPRLSLRKNLCFLVKNNNVWID